MAQEVPKQQSLELERAALARYEKLQAEAVLPVTTGGGGAVAEAKTADGAFAHQGAMKPPMSPRSAQRESTLADFMGITSSTEAVARQLLQTHNWELEASIHAYYESPDSLPLAAVSVHGGDKGL
ncbi:hypothetical protein JKP88DRAFT_354300 [Tribonema minus]|uniref:Uncharacterized protein n=1 Tax=Tribonema minus TaxID=303371 RepID=A0A835Z137_9STRA|nr:hypothetical protein JKP88DRAFT_354300 [Tribonema minus]